MTKNEFFDIIVYGREPNRVAPIFKRSPNGELRTIASADMVPGRCCRASSTGRGSGWSASARGDVLVVPQTDGSNEPIWRQDTVPLSDEWRATTATSTLLQGREPDLEPWLRAYEMAGGERS